MPKRKENGTAPKRVACQSPADRTAEEINHKSGKEGILPMAGEIFMRVNEVAEELGVSVPYAYSRKRIIRATAATVATVNLIPPKQPSQSLRPSRRKAGSTTFRFPRPHRKNPQSLRWMWAEDYAQRTPANKLLTTPVFAVCIHTASRKTGRGFRRSRIPPRRAHDTLQPQDESIIVGYYTSAEVLPRKLPRPAQSEIRR